MSPMSSPPPRLIPRSVLFGNPERTPAHVSPDGRMLAWTAPKNGLLNVFVAPVDDIAKARAVTDEHDRPILDYSWSPDSTMILYMKDTGGDENDHVICVGIDGGPPRDLTPFEGARAGIMHMSHRLKERLLIGSNDRDPTYFDIYDLDLKTGTLTRIFENDRFAGFLSDSSLTLRIVTLPRPDGGVDYYRVADNVAADEPFERVDYEDGRATAPVGFSDDGKTLYWVDSRGRDTTAFFAQNLASGEKTLIATDERVDIDTIVTHPTDSTPLAYHVEYLKPRYIALDPAVRADFECLDAALQGSWGIVSQDSANEIWTLANDPVTGPPAVHIYRRSSREVRQLYVIRPDLEGMPLVAMHPLEIPTRDGLTLVSYLSLPQGAGLDDKPAEPLPMVLYVHGGPWARDGFGYEPVHQWLANRGYAVLSANFRGSTGFGKSFVTAGDGEWGAKMQDDLDDAVDAIVARGLVDSAKVAILGGSYGGYAVLAGLAFTPLRYACGVGIVGVSELSTLLASVPPYWAPMQATFHRAIGDPGTAEGKALLTERSPLHKADAIQRPLLIGHGANDPRVKQAESDQIAAAMTANHTPLTYVLYPDEGHGFDRPTNSIAFWAITENFLATYLGGRAEPIGDALTGSSTTVKTGAEHVPGLAAALASRGAA